jgi:hypothetical protein
MIEGAVALIRERDQRDRDAQRLLEGDDAGAAGSAAAGSGTGSTGGGGGPDDSDDDEEWVFPSFDVLSMQLSNISQTFIAERPELLLKKGAPRRIAGALYR